VFLWLASEQFESILRPWLGGFFGELTNSLEPQWALLVEHHLLSWSQWVPIVVFGLAALLIFRCSLRDVFLVPSASSWSTRKSALASIIIAGLMSGVILTSTWGQLDPAWHWGIMAGNVFSNMYEEVFFRGFLFGMLLKFSRSPWWAIVVTAAFFTLAHGQYAGWESFGFFFLALPFGWLTWKSGWIFWPYVVHMLVDWIVDPWLPPGYVASYL